jgi:hypothetical protein
MSKHDDPKKPGIVSKAGEAAKGALTPAAAQKLIARVKQLEEQLQESKSTYEVDAPGLTMLGNIDDKRLKVIDETLKRLNATGLTFAPGGKTNAALESVASTFDRMTGNAGMGAKAVEELTQKFAQFGVMTENMKGGQELAEDFANQAAALDRLGLGFGEYTKNMDLAMNMFNLSSDKVKSLNQGLFDFAEQMKMMPSVVSQNFQLVAKSLSYEAPKVAEQFKKMQRLSQQTGVSIGTFMGGMGEKLDTIGGAAQFTGQLNAILGRNVFSPNQILMMDEAERMVKIREVLQESPIYNEIESGGKLGKFALNTISKLTGFSKEDTRKYILGKENDGSLKTLMAKKASGGRVTGGETKDGDKAAAAKQFFGKGDSKALENSLERLATVIKNVSLNPFDRAFVEDRAKMMPKTRGGLIAEDTLQSMALQGLARFGTDTDIEESLGIKNIKDLDADSFRRSRFRFSQVGDLVKKIQTMDEGDDKTQFQEQLQKVLRLSGAKTMTTKQEKDAFKQLQQMTRGDTKFVPASEQDDEVTFKEQKFIDLTPNIAGLKRQALEIARRGELEGPLSEGDTPSKPVQKIGKQTEAAVKTRLQRKMRKEEAKKDESASVDGSKTQSPDDITSVLESAIVSAFNNMKFIINLGPGQPDMIVNAGLKGEGLTS